jgi:predicted protein tyrosine phosphatase
MPKSFLVENPQTSNLADTVSVIGVRSQIVLRRDNTMNLHAFSAAYVSTNQLPGPSIVIQMADTREQMPSICDKDNVIASLQIIFNDAAESYGTVKAPSLNDAKKILEFVRKNPAPNLVAQCQAGIGRSQAIVAAIAKIYGDDPSPVFANGTYNQSLYDLLLRAAGVPAAIPRLVSMAVRVKYSAERLNLFLLSMRRQRYTNWEIIAVTDGPNPDARDLIASFNDSRLRLVETEKMLGRWGHPYRQLGIDACRGEYVGISNDDNYYVPGYLEQMVFALEHNNADLAICQILHSYSGWSVTMAGGDLGCWIARKRLMERCQ